MATLLEIGQAVVNELGLPPLSSIAGNSNTTARQIMALANRSGDELYQTHPWIVSQAQHIVEIRDPIITVGDVTGQSNIITNIPSTAGIVANEFAISGSYIQQSSRVINVIDANTVEIDMDATDTQLASELVIARDTFAVPDEFKWFSDRTMWDRTNHWELIGPSSPQFWQYWLSGIVTVGPRRRWRQVGTEPVNWRLWPPPTSSGDYPATMVFEFNSKYWAASADGTRKQWLTSDTDYSVIDSQAIILSTKWRLWQVKGFEYGAMQAEANDYIGRLAARDGGSPDLYLGRRFRDPFLIGPWNVQDGNFPGPGNI